MHIAVDNFSKWEDTDGGLAVPVTDIPTFVKELETVLSTLKNSPLGTELNQPKRKVHTEINKKSNLKRKRARRLHINRVKVADMLAFAQSHNIPIPQDVSRSQLIATLRAHGFEHLII